MPLFFLSVSQSSLVVVCILVPYNSVHSISPNFGGSSAFTPAQTGFERSIVHRSPGRSFRAWNVLGVSFMSVCVRNEYDAELNLSFIYVRIAAAAAANLSWVRWANV